jgi:phosphoglycerate transport regulatory protein PgtC
VTTIVPANVAVVANAPNKAGAEAFVDYLVSPAGQEVLLEPSIRRLPVNPAVYAKAPPDYPNPFKNPSLGARVRFDVDVSEKRTNAVDVLYDQTVTFQLDALKGATKAIHDAEAAIAKKDNAEAKALVKEARDLVAATPINEQQASSPEIAGAFTGGKEKGARQAQLEQQWAAFAKDRYQQAQAKAEQASKLAR